MSEITEDEYKGILDKMDQDFIDETKNIRDKYDSFENKKIILYHYTNFCGLKQIIASQTLFIQIIAV